MKVLTSYLRFESATSGNALHNAHASLNFSRIVIVDVASSKMRIGTEEAFDHRKIIRCVLVLANSRQFTELFPGIATFKRNIFSLQLEFNSINGTAERFVRCQ